MTDPTAIWSQTGACNALADVRHLHGFYTIHLDAIDAPVFLPAGSTIRNEYVSILTGENVVSLQGALVIRPGEFQQ